MIPDEDILNRHLDGVASRMRGVSDHHRKMLLYILREADARIKELEAALMEAQRDLAAYKEKR